MWAWWADGVGNMSIALVRRYWDLQRVHQAVRLEHMGPLSNFSTSSLNETPATNTEA